MEPHPQGSLSPAVNLEDEEILNNIKSRLHGPMNRFFDKFFGDLTHDNAIDIFTDLQEPAQLNFLHWFMSNTRRIQQLNGIRGSWRELPLENGSTDDGCRLLLTISPAGQPKSDSLEWNQVQIVGQFYCSQDSASYQDGLVQLCRSAISVFATQPSRLFLHGFYVWGSLLEFWVVDRSGLYCSKVLNLRHNSSQFLSVILYYHRMTDRELGNSSIINTDQDGRYVTINPSSKKLYIEDQPIAIRHDLIAHGTTCYRARYSDSRKWDAVLKFKWRWIHLRPEDELLRLAKNKNVRGAVTVDYYEEFETTADLRAGLRWGPHRQLISQEDHEASDVALGLVMHTTETDNYFQNRILTMIVTSPVGRPLHTFHSVRELLQVFCDSIKCHRSLFNDAAILHQDISPGNIVILDDQREGDPKAILIDLDSAVVLTEEPGNERGITGTRPFMAIGVLRSEHHTYRHDLESFFYVFLWTIITNRQNSPPEPSRLRQWSNSDWGELAERKVVDMGQTGFQAILDEFPSHFNVLIPLAQKIRQMLFPIRDDIIWTGTNHGLSATSELYDEIIGAFEEQLLHST